MDAKAKGDAMQRLHATKNLYDRARAALGAEKGALLEASVRDKTPCVRVYKEHGDLELIDDDSPSAWSWGGSCESTCLGMCKRSGELKFKIDAHELAVMGVSEREQSMMDGPQVAARCKEGSCKCMD